MTPAEYIKIEKEQQGIIAAATARIADARALAQISPPPVHRRAAKASDIVEGAIIWHEREEQYGGDFWQIVESPLRYGDRFKAYEADDGCRYGLQGAYVEDSP